ncbi:hypothetical protein MUG91_G1346n1 [Manis pentadactyla]|nr:hypothetical protein MUG91_G1346n1 [Manis pentadactyla]
MARLSFRFMVRHDRREFDYVVRDISIRKELGSGSDEGERWWIRFWRMCDSVPKDYSEARVISMMTVEFQATVRR